MTAVLNLVVFLQLAGYIAGVFAGGYVCVKLSAQYEWSVPILSFLIFGTAVFVVCSTGDEVSAWIHVLISSSIGIACGLLARMQR